MANLDIDAEWNMSGTRKLKLELPETLLLVAQSLAEHDKCETTDVIYCLLTNGISALMEQNADNGPLCICLMQACKDIDKLASPHLPRQETEIPRRRGTWHVQ